MSFSSMKFLSDNKGAVKAAGSVGAKGASATYKYAKENPDQVKKGADWARENPDAAKKVYNAGSSYAANNENPTDPKTMSNAALKYAKENPEDAKRYASQGAKFARDNPDTVKSVSSFAAKEYGYDTKNVDNAVTAATYYDKYGSQLDKASGAAYGTPSSPKTQSHSSLRGSPAAYQSPSQQWKAPPASGWSGFDDAAPPQRPTTSAPAPASRGAPPVPGPTSMKSMPASGWAGFDDIATDSPADRQTTSISSSSFHNTGYRPAPAPSSSGPTRRIFREMPDVPPRPHPDEIWLIAKATEDFTAEYGVDLSFQAGDIIRVAHTMHADDHWWRGELYGQIGYFPACYIEFLDD